MQIDVDGSGMADITLTMTGLTTANQLGATDLMWSEATNADPVENTGGVTPSEPLVGYLWTDEQSRGAVAFAPLFSWAGDSSSPLMALV